MINSRGKNANKTMVNFYWIRWPMIYTVQEQKSFHFILHLIKFEKRDTFYVIRFKEIAS